MALGCHRTVLHSCCNRLDLLLLHFYAFCISSNPQFSHVRVRASSEATWLLSEQRMTTDKPPLYKARVFLQEASTVVGTVRAKRHASQLQRGDAAPDCQRGCHRRLSADFLLGDTSSSSSSSTASEAVERREERPPAGNEGSRAGTGHVVPPNQPSARE